MRRGHSVVARRCVMRACLDGQIITDTMKINKHIIINLIAIASVIPAFAQEKQAEIDTTDVFYRHLNLKEVVVTGATGETRLKNSSAPVKMLTGREM